MLRYEVLPRYFCKELFKNSKFPHFEMDKFISYYNYASNLFD